MKRRKVQFSDPPVSDLAEIPRTPSQGSLKTSLKTKLLPKQKSVDATAEAADNDSCGLYVATPPPVDVPGKPVSLHLPRQKIDKVSQHTI